jgi:hypothetical protein
VTYFDFLWTEEIIEHLAQHDVMPEQFEEIVKFPESRGVSARSGRPCCWGETPDGRYLICIYERLDDMTILPVTAYEVPAPGEESSHG